MSKKKSSTTNMTATEHKFLFREAKIDEIKKESLDIETPNAIKVNNNTTSKSQ